MPCHKLLLFNAARKNAPAINTTFKTNITHNFSKAISQQYIQECFEITKERHLNF